jgi:hypothetical protein
VFKSIGSIERRQIATVTGSKPNKRGHNQNTVRHEGSSHLRGTKMAQHATHGKNKKIGDLCRGVNEFKK